MTLTISQDHKIEYFAENGARLWLLPRRNIDIFHELSKLEIPKPRPPLYQIPNTDNFAENTFHPNYARAIDLYNTEIMINVFRIVLQLAIEQDDTLIDKSKLRRKTKEQAWLDFLGIELTDSDLNYIVNICFLTENLVLDIFDVLVQSILRGGQSIQEARLKHGINSNITLQGITIGNLQLVHPTDEFMAMRDSNLNYEQWFNLLTSQRAEIIALFRVNKMIENHAEDEVQDFIDKKNK